MVDSQRKVGDINMLTIENTLLLVIDFQERLMPSIHRHEELAQKTAAFIKGCRILDLPVLTTQQYTKGLGDTIPAIKDALGEFEPVEKITFSCCKTAAFNDELIKTGRKAILVTGIEAHICVQQTVLDLLENGYQVYLIADCIGSRRENDLLYAEARMQKAGTIITTMESALFELLVRADHPKRKEISNLVK